MSTQATESATPVEPVESPAAAATPTDPPKPADPAKTAGQTAAAGTDSAVNVWEDPEAAKAEIERLRKENGAARTNAKAKAADEAKRELAQTIGKALGLVENEPIDPAVLTQQLTTSQAEAKQARVELAVFRNATAAGGDPAALLDSTSFLASLADVDPTDNEAVTAAITAAVAGNPRLAVPATPGMKPNPAQGRSASPPLGLAEQIAAATEKGDVRGALRLKASQALQNGPSS